jgi:hypothetical protein
MLRRLLIVLMAVVLMLGGAPSRPALAQSAPCRFTLGFAKLRAAIGSTRVGDCLEDEHFNPESGTTQQRAFGGLFIWRQADNWIAFTDGATTWIDGPSGVVSRPNSERFPWEREPVPSRDTATPPVLAPTTTTPTILTPTSDGSDSAAGIARYFPGPAQVPPGFSQVDEQVSPAVDGSSPVLLRQYASADSTSVFQIVIAAYTSSTAAASGLDNTKALVGSKGYASTTCAQCVHGDDRVFAGQHVGTTWNWVYGFQRGSVVAVINLADPEGMPVPQTAAYLASLTTAIDERVKAADQ